MPSTFDSWRRQPTTITGIAGLVGLMAHAIALYLTGDPSYTVAVGAVAAALVLLVMNDNTQAAADASVLAIDTVKAAATHTLDIKIPRLMDDLLNIWRDIAFKRYPHYGSAADVPGADRPVVDPANAATVAKAAVVPAILLAFGIGLQACTVAQQHVGCQVDTVTVPIADAAVTGLVPTASGAVAVDAALVHPAIQAYCAALGGLPVPTSAVAAVPTAVPAVKP